MAVKIVLPKGDGVKTPNGTKVYTKDGHEIEDIIRIEIDIQPDRVITAKLHVPVDSIENLVADGLIVPDKDGQYYRVADCVRRFTEAEKQQMRKEYRDANPNP